MAFRYLAQSGLDCKSDPEAELLDNSRSCPLALAVGRAHLLQTQLKVVLACSHSTAKCLAGFVSKAPQVEG